MTMEVRHMSLMSGQYTLDGGMNVEVKKDRKGVWLVPGVLDPVLITTCRKVSGGWEVTYNCWGKKYTSVLQSVTA